MSQKGESLNLDNESDWRRRLFFWSLKIVDEFTGGCQSVLYTRGTNLCHFMRVIVVYMPLVILLHILLVGGAICVFVFIPVWFFGPVVDGIILTVIALIIGVCYWAKIEGKKPRKPYIVLKEPLVVPRWTERAHKEMPKAPSTWSMIWAWVVAQKKRICPLITFSDSKEVTNE